MKATELRIGNIVNYCNSVKQLDAELFLQLLKYTTPFEPITLTEEWLLKFGFVDRGLGDFRRSWLHLIRNSSTSFETNCFFVKIKYIHQLQNLYFALTGEELTINQ